MWKLSEKKLLVENTGRIDDSQWVEIFIDIVDSYMNYYKKNSNIKNYPRFSQWVEPFIFYVDTKIKEIEDKIKIKINVSGLKYLCLPFNTILGSLSQEYNPDWDNILDVKTKAIQCSLRLRGMTNICDTFVKMIHSSMNRIYEDNQDISACFFKGKDITCYSVKLLDADYHGSQTGVFLIEYDCGKIVYKPRDLSICHLWNYFVKTCAPNYLKSVKCLTKDEYGYMEYIENSRPDPAKVNEYFFNWGAFLAACCIFRSSDLHDNNIFICNNSPLFIDMETLITPSSIWEKKNKIDVFEYLIKQGLLSSYHSVNQKSFLSNKYGYLMKEARRLCENECIDQSQIIKQVQEGFLKVMNHMICSRESLINEFRKPKYHHIPVRFLVRDTKIYYRLLESGYRKSGPSNFIIFERELDRLHLAFKKFKDTRLLEIGDWEIDDIRNGNIPIFYIPFHDKYIYHHGYKNNGKLLSESPLECLTTSIINFDKTEINSYLNAIEIIMKKLFIDSTSIDETKVAKWEKISDLSFKKEDIEYLLQQIKQNILNNRISIQNGKSHWMENRKSGIWIADHSLFDGRLGIALFLSIYAHYFCDSKAKEEGYNLYMECVQAYQNALKSFGEGPIMPWSLMHGISGLLYVSAFYWNLGYQDASKKSIEDALGYLEKSPIPTKLDLYDGIAGTIVALCRVNHIIDTSKLLRKLCQNLCHQVKLKQVHKNDDSWAHGLAGILYALLKAAEILKDEYYIQFAVSRLENIHADENSSILGLCRGKIGLYYAISFVPCDYMTEKLKMLELYGQEICLTQKISNVNNLCCGDAGLRQLAIRYYQKTKEKKYLFAAWHKDIVNINSNIGLLSGMSGIGYALIHLFYGDEMELFWK